jgi:hypothetical protein
MATAMTGSQMLAACRKWKVDVHEYPGYATRRAGSWGEVHGIVIHHVGSDASQSGSYLDFLFRDGRSDVPAPLCNVATQMDGDLHLGALGGRANHAGRGSSGTLAKVRSGNYDGYAAGISPGPDDMNGNPHYYGNECCFDGGQPMTRAMWVSTVLWCAAICDFHGWSALRVIAHKEHSTRKIDPGSTSMPALRRDVRAALNAGPGNWPTPQGGEWDMATADEVLAAVNALDTKITAYQKLEGDRWAQGVNENRAQTTTLLGVIAAQQEIIDAVAFNQNAEAGEDDAEEALAGQRWAQAVEENRAAAAAAAAAAESALAKLDALLAAHQPAEPEPPKA